MPTTKAQDRTAQPAPKITLPGALLIILRLLLLLPSLAICVTLHHLWSLFTRRRVWPQIFFNILCRVIGLRCRIVGTPRHGALYLANHVSWMDIPALLSTTATAFVAHDGLAGIRILKYLCDLNETVFIARHRRSTVGEQAQQVREAMDDDGALTLFPEGTTSDGTGLLPFKSALLSAIEPLPPGTHVQPVWLDYPEAPHVSWVGDEPGLDNFLMIMARWRPVRLNLHFLPELAGDELTNRKTMAAAAYAALLRAHGIARPER